MQIRGHEIVEIEIARANDSQKITNEKPVVKFDGSKPTN